MSKKDVESTYVPSKSPPQQQPKAILASTYIGAAAGGGAASGGGGGGGGSPKSTGGQVPTSVYVGGAVQSAAPSVLVHAPETPPSGGPVSDMVVDQPQKEAAQEPTVPSNKTKKAEQGKLLPKTGTVAKATVKQTGKSAMATMAAAKSEVFDETKQADSGNQGKGEEATTSVSGATPKTTTIDKSVKSNVFDKSTP